MREWVRRALAGYWTHAGYLNWDTGMGFLRWHQRKKVGLAHGALIGIAAEPELAPSPRWSGWAKWMLDRGLRDYVALSEREDRVPAALAYGVHAVPEPRRMAYLAAARYAANAVKALEAGLGRRPASAPPALYSFDPDTGRLAVTTPAYNTAIVAANQKAHPYGGVEIARLFDARQEVAANVGGTGVNAFGIHVRDRSGRLLLRTQYGKRSGRAPLELVRAPRGVGASTTAREQRALRRPVHRPARARPRRGGGRARGQLVPLHPDDDRRVLDDHRPPRERDAHLADLGTIRASLRAAAGRTLRRHHPRAALPRRHPLAASA